MPLKSFALLVLAALGSVACGSSNGDSNSSDAHGGTATSGSAGTQQGGGAGTQQGGVSGTQQGGNAGTQQGGNAGTQQGGNSGSDQGGSGGNAGSSGSAGLAMGGSAGVGGSGGSNAGNAGSGGRGGTAGTGGAGADTFSCGPLMCEQGEQICHRTLPALPGGTEMRMCEAFPASCSARDCSCFCNPPSRSPCGPAATCVCTGDTGRIQVVCSGA
jgi:hypothetical protein